MFMAGSSIFCIPIYFIGAYFKADGNSWSEVSQKKYVIRWIRSFLQQIDFPVSRYFPLEGGGPHCGLHKFIGNRNT